MVVMPPQPTLPPEGVYTAAELNFIDESPRGFFPDNQDSNWGYRRKIFTDQVQDLFDQLDLIFSEIFPQTSQEYLDEWEKLVGLPTNPANKTLEQRRQLVINRLRGGPFTRTQRREIVESYITATFGDPIILLPPGVPMVVAGTPLYNEPGDVNQLYQIIETVPSFQYEVRIQSGLAIDQVGLERDLKWFTPAGINIIFNYAWTGKWATDSGTGADTVTAASGAALKLFVVDSGVGSEAVKYFGTDTGTATENATVARAGTDTGTASAESAAMAPARYTPVDGGIGVEDITGRRLATDIDAGTSVENAVKTGSGGDFSSGG